MATRATLNWRFFLATTFALLAALGIMHFWHGRQVRTQTGAYLKQADLARDKKDERREIAYLERFLRVQPRSDESRERLARLYAKNARTGKQIEDAFFLLEDCVRREPDRDDLRRFTVEFAMDPRTSLVLEVKDHLTYLLNKNPDDADAVERMGTYLAAKLDFHGAIKEFSNAYRLQADRLNAYAGHAILLRDRLNQPDQADGVITRMIGQNGENSRAHLFAFEYGRKYQVPQFIEREIKKARALAPDDLDVLLAHADWCRADARQLQLRNDSEAKTRLAEARAELLRGSALARSNVKPDTQLPPQAVAILLMQAAIEAETESPAAAAKILTEGSRAFPGNVAVLATLVDYQIQAKDLAGADATFASLDKLDVSSPRLAYDHARLTFAKRNWLSAARELRRILDEQPSEPAFVRSLNYLLGQCYEQIGETDRRLTAFTRSIPDDINDPLWVLAQLGQADAYAALGRADDALRTYLKLTDRVPRVWLAVTRLQILQSLRTADPTSINWGPANEAVQKCQAALPDSTEAKLVKAELLFFQNLPDEARAIIDPLFEIRKREPAVWIAKAFSQSRQSNLGEAIKLLDQGRQELGDPVELRLAQAQLLVQSKAEKPELKLMELVKDIERYTPADRRRLLHGLADTATGSGFVKQAGEIWDLVIRLNADDLHAHLVRFDRAFRSNEERELMRMRNEIARIDGVDGVSTRIADAFVLIGKEQQTNDLVGLDAAMKMLDRLEDERPDWGRIAIGKALIFERKSNGPSALAHYRKAVNLGETQPEYLRRLINLLAQRGQYDEANSVLNRLSNDDLGSPDAMRLAADVSLRADNPKRALELAAKAVSSDSNNHEDYLWKGRLFWSVSDRAGALSAFRKAKELNPGDPTAWLLLIETLVADKQTAEAESVFREASGKVRDNALLFQAQSQKLLGHKVEAQRAFQDAREKQPHDVKVLRAEADFLMLESKMAEACDAWKRVIRLSAIPPEEKAYAQNMLVICLALHPDYSTARSAVTALGLDQAGTTLTETSISKRTQAVVLSLQPDRTNKLKAIRLFQSEGMNLTDNDRFLLAQWYFQVNNEGDGRKVLTSLLSRPPADRNPLFLAFFAGWLLSQSQGDANEAAPWVARLEKIEPNSLRTIEVKVRMLAKQQDLAAARAILKEQGEKPNAKFLSLAGIAEDAKLDPDAESLIKRFIESERGKKTPEPDLDLRLAGYYARRGRLKESLDVCEKAWDTCSPEKVGKLCVEALSITPQVDPATLNRVAGWLETAKTKYPNFAPALKQNLAFLRNLQGDYEKALLLYEELSRAREPDPTVLNNFAYLLSVIKAEHDKALVQIASAKLLIGPHPDLLDTEALIRIARNQPGDLPMARALLKEAFDQATNASIKFHEARLEEKAGNRDASRQAWREAQNLKLKEDDLHPLEREQFKKMMQTHR